MWACLAVAPSGRRQSVHGYEHVAGDPSVGNRGNWGRASGLGVGSGMAGMESWLIEVGVELSRLGI
jgi:hypothetical protein